MSKEQELIKEIEEGKKKIINSIQEADKDMAWIFDWYGNSRELLGIKEGKKEQMEEVIKLINEKIEKEKQYFKKDDRGINHCSLCMEDGYCIHESKIDVLEGLRFKLKEMIK